MTDKLELIRRKCIEANPEIVKLEFGCEVLTKYAEDGPYQVLCGAAICSKHKRVKDSCYQDDDNKGCDVSDGVLLLCSGEDGYYTFRILEKDVYETLGRPIRLADVLLAVDGASEYDSFVERQQNAVLALTMNRFGNGRYVGPSLWNLREDDLSKQSEETISFLYELLTP